MDIQAAITGLKALKQPCRVTLYNNNTYLVDAITKGWVVKWRAQGWTNSDRKPTPHSDLWEELAALCAAHEVSFVYLRLDGQDREHSRCDSLAHEAAEAVETIQAVD
jgi:ribonuclease HI